MANCIKIESVAGMNSMVIEPPDSQGHFRFRINGHESRLTVYLGRDEIRKLQEYLSLTVAEQFGTGVPLRVEDHEADAMPQA